MNPFELLHPSLQFHIVNSLGWRQLRPFQEQVILPALGGEDLLILAPTAGGKTEAAFFPLASRMLSESWDGTSILYVCPIKALLNNLEPRLSRYCSLLGRRAAVWHGDVTAAARAKQLSTNPHLLLTTPESLEAMLVSTSTERRQMLASARAVIVDELHAFAGDDRGWHLLAVLERLDGLCGRQLQRVGLSATVGNPDGVLEWLCAGRRTPRRLLRPDGVHTTDADVLIDHVGTIQNAATVLSRLHRSEKRLVFVDSRLRAERLAAALMEAGTKTFITHSSLSKEERHRAEAAFAQATDCVIVATSVLELGLDVGDLDRVVQLDAPATVGSFLQRMGRTGRRPGTSRNCLFLSTTDAGLIQAAAVVDLWKSGFVENVVPPLLPYHVLLQQILARTLEGRGLGAAETTRGIDAFMSASGIHPEDAASLVEHLLKADVLFEAEGILWFGRAGERDLGWRHFSELLSVIASEPLVTLVHGRQELGSVHPLSFANRKGGQVVLTLAGRAWRVTHVDWPRRKAFVEPTDARGMSRWQGSSAPLSNTLCQSMRRVLTDGTSARLSRRAGEQLEGIRNEFTFLDGCGTYLQRVTEDRWTWWTFAGLRSNAPAAEGLRNEGLVAEPSNLHISVVGAGVEQLRAAIDSVIARPDLPIPEPESEDDHTVKLEKQLPRSLRERLRRSRLTDLEGYQALLQGPIRFGN